ncbi:MAG: phosphate/phosphite/phosphonate ABC transporter substrate-binding protein [Desulfobulbaceae bacterium]|nr:phosphate/phosphite/phosphonate ABC transporter substrate-binding protein [Desulfobulbaceae bacterium]
MKGIRKKKSGILPGYALFLLLLLTIVTEAAIAHDTLILAVHPYLPFSELQKRFSPLAEYLGKETGSPVIVRVGSDYQEHIDAIGKNYVDIAYMGPASYVKMVEKYGGKPLLARLSINGSPHFKGFIITRKDSPFHSLADLKGRYFAFGDPNSTMSHLVPRFMLLEAGVQKNDLKGFEFLRSHNNVVLGVLSGDFDAGAIKEEVFQAFSNQGIRKLATSPSLSEHILVASSSLPEQKITALRQALFHLPSSKDGKQVLSSIKSQLTAFVPVQDSDYDNLRQILDRLKKEDGRQ